MKNNKGFTLVEILAVLVLISLMMVIIVPNVQKVALNSKIKLCKSKINLAEESINLWARDNYKCFEKTDGCNILSNCQTNNDTIKCESTFKTLAENNLLNYDKIVENIKYVINPINNGNMNNTIINIKYNKVTKQATSSLSETDKLKICSKDADEITPAVIEKITDPSDDNNNSKAAEFLEKLYNNDASSNGLEKDDTTDKNLRYVGASPNNYLKFNNETWRIVGVFNNITSIDKNDKEKKESLVKIVRNDSLGDYSWDSSASTINNGWGVNEWSQADLMTKLNTDYINQNPPSTTTFWCNGQNNAQNGTYNYSKNIKSSSIDKVAKVRWNTSRARYGASALNSYNQERSTTLIGAQSDNVPRTNTWDGKIALMYPSDYGYASTNTACRDNMNSKTNDVYNCKNENWLFNSANQWTLSPVSGTASGVVSVLSGGFVYSRIANLPYGVRPVLFLKSDVVIAGGTGTQSDPFTI